MSALLLPLPFKPSVKTDANNSVSATILHSGEMALTCLWRRARLQKATKGYKLDIIRTLYNVRTPWHPLADERKLSFDFYNTFCNNFNLDWQEIVKNASSSWLRMVTKWLYEWSWFHCTRLIKDNWIDDTKNIFQFHVWLHLSRDRLADDERNCLLALTAHFRIILIVLGWQEMNKASSSW